MMLGAGGGGSGPGSVGCWPRHAAADQPDSHFANSVATPARSRSTPDHIGPPTVPCPTGQSWESTDGRICLAREVRFQRRSGASDGWPASTACGTAAPPAVRERPRGSCTRARALPAGQPTRAPATWRSRQDPSAGSADSASGALPDRILHPRSPGGAKRNPYYSRKTPRASSPTWEIQLTSRARRAGPAGRSWLGGSPLRR
jgi:hypothetical protein